MTTVKELVFHLLGQGMRLVVYRDTNHALLKFDPRYSNDLDFEIPVTKKVYTELEREGLISPLPEFEDNHKIGWREMKFPNEQNIQSVYACTQ